MNNLEIYRRIVWNNSSVQPDNLTNVLYNPVPETNLFNENKDKNLSIINLTIISKIPVKYKINKNIINRIIYAIIDIVLFLI